MSSMPKTMRRLEHGREAAAAGESKIEALEDQVASQANLINILTRENESLRLENESLARAKEQHDLTRQRTLASWDTLRHIFLQACLLQPRQHPLALA
jgi:hypothetical protein